MMNEAAKVNLISCLADAMRNSIAACGSGLWLCAASTMTGDRPAVPAEQSAMVTSLRLRGTLSGELRVEISAKDLRILFAGSEGAAIDAGSSWKALMDAVVKQLPKRAADAGVFAFSVESYCEADSSEGAVQIGRMELMESESTQILVRVLADNELIENLQIADWAASRNRARTKSKESVMPELDRVIDVPLNVTLRFGQRTMRLREVLDLSPGALVELDRQVEDPVDLILDERVIARGEVVIVDGNYGLRVTEIVENGALVA
ncbi:MAG TPA: flagellar motor switch protein FliN [Acidobacteriaceae bacterium]|nr:flagellar motor switch protein FliN [Acidobacteriaceae bacterium]